MTGTLVSSFTEPRKNGDGLIALLKVPVEEAVERLDAYICEGHLVLAAIRGEYSEISASGVSSEKAKQWEHMINSWLNNVYSGLKKVYTSHRESFNFDLARTQRYTVSGSNPIYQNFENTLEAKLDYLNKLLEYILYRPNISITAKGDLFIQDGMNNKMEVKK